jgi:hypothetical protein
MQVTYDLTADDLTAFIRDHRTRTMPPTFAAPWKGSRFWLWLLLYFLLLFGLSALPESLFEIRFSKFSFIWGFFAGILFALCFHRALGGVWTLEEGVRRRFETNPREYVNLTCSLTPEGIRHSSLIDGLLRRWHAVDQLAVTPQHVFIYLTPDFALIVPRRIFASESECEEFISLAARYLEEAQASSARPFQPASTLPSEDEIFKKDDGITR